MKRAGLYFFLLALPAALAASDVRGPASFVNAFRPIPAQAAVAERFPAANEMEFAPGLDFDDPLSMAAAFTPVAMQNSEGEGGGRRGRENDENGNMPPRPGWRGRRSMGQPPPVGRRGPMPPPRWLTDQMKHLSPEEQERVLRNSERFQELPKQRQDQLLQRLHRFQELPPDQRGMILQRYGAFNRLTPEQQQKTRELLPQWRALPPDRKQAFLEEFRHMRGMSPEEREKYLSSHDLDNRYNAEERDLLRQLNSLEPPMPPPPDSRP